MVLVGFMYYMSHRQTQQPSSPEQVITLIWFILQRIARSKSYLTTSERDFADESKLQVRVSNPTKDV